MRDSTGNAMRQCLLSMKDAGGRNGRGAVYGFVTPGLQWRVIRYDGPYFLVADEFSALFAAAGRDREQ